MKVNATQDRTDAAGSPPPTIQLTGIDAYTPAEIARRVEVAGRGKAALPLEQLATLSLMAGVFISFGAALYTMVMTGNTLGFGPGRLVGGIAFSLGLMLIIIGGAKLFTGNTLIVMAWADRKVSSRALGRNWGVSFVVNIVGALLMVLLVHWSGVLEIGGSGDTAVKIAEAKAALSFKQAFFRGVLCNLLVCLAVWLSFACHSVADKILAIILPIAGFVTLGFEHSIANCYLIPIGMLAGAKVGVAGFLGNLLPVTLGNIVGGAGGVAGVYWLIYLRGAHAPAAGK